MRNALNVQRQYIPSQISLADNFGIVRAHTEAICAALEIEDQVIQPAPFVSPPKWHLGHTTWFFDRFILQPLAAGSQRSIAETDFLFNSYYKSQGKHWAQAARGQLSRPTVREVLNWRRAVTDELLDQLQRHMFDPQQLNLIDIGIHHEQQHQELLLMDIKYILGMQPSAPAYTTMPAPPLKSPQPLSWLAMEEGFCEIGAAPGFAFDNECPRHRRWLGPHAMASRLVANGEFLEFVMDDGYHRPELWLSDGWDWVQQHQVCHPLYWRSTEQGWLEYQFGGLQPLQPGLPVSHVSYYEAEAFARWHGVRLPEEAELENFLHRYGPAAPWNQGWVPEAPLHPGAAGDYKGNGALWQWTTSAYAPYPGFVADTGALGEYNSKFMCNQYVLRGGCFATPRGHLRHSYRNFYRAHDRWAFTGIRLARELK